MKRISILFLGTILSVSAFAQVRIPSDTRFQVDKAWKELRTHPGNPLPASLPVARIEGKEYVSFLAKVNDSFNSSIEENYGIRIGSRTGNIVTLRIPAETLGGIHQLPGIDYLQLAGKINPMLNKSVKETHADSVHQGIGLPQPFTGKDVIIGITDWGFDYTHPMFYDTNLSETRILAAWDQYKNSGPSPSGFGYGTEYADITSLLDAKSDTSNIYGKHYHGTHCAGIAGGGGAGTIYRGLAFEANFLFCTFLIDEAAVLDAYNWMKAKADAEGKRLVISQSWGLHHFGTLDGTSLLSQAIDNYSSQGIVFVSSGGNNGDVNFHIRHTFAQDTICSRISFDSYAGNPNMWGQSITAWGTQGAPFSVSAAVYNASGTWLAQTPFYATDLASSYVDSFLVVNTDTIFYNLSADNSFPLNQKPHVRFRIKNENTAYRINLFAAANAGQVDFWNVTELTTGVGNWGMPFSSPGLPGSASGDHNYGISEPACTESTISVAAYQSQNNNAGGYIASFSSFGPRPDERLKPDISAPGVNVASSINSYTDNAYTSLTTISFNGRTYPFGRLSGTSMAAPTVAGIVALMLDANPWLTPSDVKDILLETAREDAKTGDLPDTGDVRWGYGKVNAYAAVKAAFYFTGIPVEDQPELIVYPNPVTSSLQIFGLEQDEKYTLRLYSTEGKMVFMQNNISGSTPVSIAQLPAGMYILELCNEGQRYYSRVVKSE
jgi:subtilisin family serine protease